MNPDPGKRVKIQFRCPLSAVPASSLNGQTVNEPPKGLFLYFAAFEGEYLAAASEKPFFRGCLLTDERRAAR
jgi:hypothetical protein